MDLGNVKKGFGAEVRRRRNHLGFSQEELAERANLHRTYISDVEAGKRNPSLASIQRLATALGAPLSAVFCATEDGSSKAASAMEDRIVNILLVDADRKASQLTQSVFKTFKLTNCL